MIKKFDTEEYLKKDLLRFTTAGSVDDGKSTLIGRMLFDSKSIFQDQMDALERTSELRGEGEVNLALLTDGLRSEREQGITIDVAYRYFSTAKRKFIIADTPGHVQYTRNMVTGASTADLAIILIDARNGVLTQSKRHGFIASLLGIPHLMVAVNKMDLVDYSQERYAEIVQDYTDFSKKLNIHDITFIPVSALKGDNVVNPSPKMTWYSGPTILSHLENVTIAADRNLVDFRFPVQYVIRPHQNFRGFSGRIASGTVKPGEEIIALPSAKTSTVKEIVTADGNLKEAFEGQTIVITLEDELDISRGDMIVRKNNLPTTADRIDTTVCWMDDRTQLCLNKPYLLQQATRRIQVMVRELRYRINVDTLHREMTDTLDLNDIGRCIIQTANPLYFDPYTSNKETGSFVLIDPATDLTVGAGMIRDKSHTTQEASEQILQETSQNIRWESGMISREQREKRNEHAAAVLWLTGLSGSGKTTIARELEKKLFNSGEQAFILDGDNVRHGLNGDLGFSPQDRLENIRRVAHVSRLMYEAGMVVICSFISPSRKMRDYARSLFPDGGFYEVYVKCDVEECRKRDPKGLYRKADNGEISDFTGVSAPYEEPISPEIVLDTNDLSLVECVETMLTSLPS
jgi:bifunctional enzyme CysN/CysC